MALLFVRLPTGFLPDEDQGFLFTQFTLPTGAHRRADRGGRWPGRALLPGRREGQRRRRSSPSPASASAATARTRPWPSSHLKDWTERPGAAEQRPGDRPARHAAAVAAVRDGQVFALVPPAVLELGNATGFDFELEDRGGLGHAALVAARNQLLGMAAQDPMLAAVRPNGLDDTPQLTSTSTRPAPARSGLSLADINDTFSAAWGGAFINKFVDRGRVKQVFMQGDAPFRTRPEDLGQLVRARRDRAPWRRSPPSPPADWTFGPDAAGALQRPAGAGDPGPAGARQEHRRGHGARWRRWSASCRRASATSGPAFPTGAGCRARRRRSLYALSLLVVFLCLAALYESWSIPSR